MNTNARGFELPLFLRLFRDFYTIFEEEGYFQEAFGYECVDADDRVSGTLGSDIEAQMVLHLRKVDLWPILLRYPEYTEDDVFDVLEFLYDHVSKPIPQDGDYHSYSGCGYHYRKFDSVAGREEFRAKATLLLHDYSSGYELSSAGEILALGDIGLESLLEASLPDIDLINVASRMEAAVLKFRYHRSSLDERRSAIRDLADVLEFLRPRLKQVLTKKDESDLFDIANNFGIRHHNLNQKTNYDPSIWYSWMFYYYLATLHAAVRLIQKHEEDSKA